jgi:hypothetical protein
MYSEFFEGLTENGKEIKYRCLVEDSEVALEQDDRLQEFDLPAELIEAFGGDADEYEDGMTIRVYNIPSSNVSQISVQAR